MSNLKSFKDHVIQKLFFILDYII